MKSVLMLIAGAAVGAGCATAGVEIPPRDRSWIDAGTPGTSIKSDRDTPYYKDENGVLWDDRGEKRDNTL